jgi:glycosyltransferase involved in cell wall biosynthesis
VRLLKDPTERARLGRAGYTRTTSEFTWDKIIDRIEGLYKELASPELLPVSVNAGRASI